MKYKRKKRKCFLILFYLHYSNCSRVQVSKHFCSYLNAVDRTLWGMQEGDKGVSPTNSSESSFQSLLLLNECSSSNVALLHKQTQKRNWHCKLFNIYLTMHRLIVNKFPYTTISENRLGELCTQPDSFLQPSRHDAIFGWRKRASITLLSIFSQLHRDSYLNILSPAWSTEFELDHCYPYLSYVSQLRTDQGRHSRVINIC